MSKRALLTLWPSKYEPWIFKALWTKLVDHTTCILKSCKVLWPRIHLLFKIKMCSSFLGAFSVDIFWNRIFFFSCQLDGKWYKKDLEMQDFFSNSNFPRFSTLRRISGEKRGKFQLLQKFLLYYFQLQLEQRQIREHS